MSNILIFLHICAYMCIILDKMYDKCNMHIRKHISVFQVIFTLVHVQTSDCRNANSKSFNGICEQGVRQC